jgi:hypothetical protein
MIRHNIYLNILCQHFFLQTKYFFLLMTLNLIIYSATHTSSLFCIPKLLIFITKQLEMLLT